MREFADVECAYGMSPIELLAVLGSPSIPSVRRSSTGACGSSSRERGRRRGGASKVLDEMPMR